MKELADCKNRSSRTHRFDVKETWRCVLADAYLIVIRCNAFRSIVWNRIPLFLFWQRADWTTTSKSGLRKNSTSLNYGTWKMYAKNCTFQRSWDQHLVHLIFPFCVTDCENQSTRARGRAPPRTRHHRRGDAVDSVETHSTHREEAPGMEFHLCTWSWSND